ncbi:DUF2752 domain-containing protein [Nocardioides sp.]|jgi:hypothetical protein|uniref:DUF2752 domain-containing protein n=1 Tax=Nocardioides sp. TaxID=35761 RepID=UPI00262B09ED|nr:DUF2752 domain-containing protein [Nocardioides sp.]
MPVEDRRPRGQGSGERYGSLAAAPTIMAWTPRDRYWPATVLAVVGLGVAAAMALFGLPGVDLHPITHRWGIMDPLCGGTRAARYTMVGDLGQAWRYNPLGIVVVMGAALAIVRAGYGAATHRWLTLQWSVLPLRTKRLVFALGVLAVVALEIRQQGRAELLMAGTGL